jgi:hypothetical protein
MKIKTQELTGAALDWAVAKCEERGGQAYLRDGKWYDPLTEEYLCYSTDWSQGGPIIEREWLEVKPWPNESDEDTRWRAKSYDTLMPTWATGPTPLIAAMRCYVASKLGDKIEVPDELL